MTHTLVLLRHGESVGNAQGIFTGWQDFPLTALGETQAVRAGRLLAEADLLPDVVHTSLRRRAIATANLALDACDRHWIPVRRSWRLNERHYGALEGQEKKAVRERVGDATFRAVRRSFEVAPPAADAAAAAARPHPEIEPVILGEALRDVVERALPYWRGGIVPDLEAGRVVLVAAHGNSIRALVKYLDGIDDAAIADLEIPNGIPIRYDLRPGSLAPVVPGGVPLDPEAAAAAVAAAARIGR